MRQISIPVSDEDVRSLRVGDVVELDGVGFTGRDTAHKYIVERFIEGKNGLDAEDRRLLEALEETLAGGFIYHCGPIVRFEDGRWRFVSSGPTTSARIEAYQDRVIERFNLKIIIGKGGMGENTLKACKRFGCVYLQGVGGTGVLSAERVVEVLDVFKKEEFGLPEALWKIRVRGFTGIVTMDSHGSSLYNIQASEISERFSLLLEGKQARG
ncbi:MAG: fumarate hydrolyase [Nitrospirae bacterium]|nr:MAG: fumarate hydrolyase [Nitrospirota bacterium]